MIDLPKCPECGQSLNPGATGKFPYGRLNPDDQGELRVVILDDGGVLSIHFGKSVSWVALSPREARVFAAALVARAEQIERGE